jgi:hypothetical protein
MQYRRDQRDYRANIRLAYALIRRYPDQTAYWRDILRINRALLDLVTYFAAETLSYQYHDGESPDVLISFRTVQI